MLGPLVPVLSFWASRPRGSERLQTTHGLIVGSLPESLVLCLPRDAPFPSLIGSGAPLDVFLALARRSPPLRLQILCRRILGSLRRASVCLLGGSRLPCGRRLPSGLLGATLRTLHERSLASGPRSATSLSSLVGSLELLLLDLLLGSARCPLPERLPGLLGPRALVSARGSGLRSASLP